MRKASERTSVLMQFGRHFWQRTYVCNIVCTDPFMFPKGESDLASWQAMPIKILYSFCMIRVKKESRRVARTRKANAKLITQFKQQLATSTCSMYIIQSHLARCPVNCPLPLGSRLISFITHDICSGTSEFRNTPLTSISLNQKGSPRRCAGNLFFFIERILK